MHDQVFLVHLSKRVSDRNCSRQTTGYTQLCTWLSFRACHTQTPDNRCSDRRQTLTANTS